VALMALLGTVNMALMALLGTVNIKTKANVAFHYVLIEDLTIHLCN